MNTNSDLFSSDGNLFDSETRAEYNKVRAEHDTHAEASRLDFGGAQTWDEFNLLIRLNRKVLADIGRAVGEGLMDLHRLEDIAKKYALGNWAGIDDAIVTATVVKVKRLSEKLSDFPEFAA